MEEALDPQIDADNFQTHYLRFRDRQAGISLIYEASQNSYRYNVYCLETKLLKEIFSLEFDFLDDAIISLNQEFGTWELVAYEQKSGCGSCVAK